MIGHKNHKEVYAGHCNDIPSVYEIMKPIPVKHRFLEFDEDMREKKDIKGLKKL